ncbi:MAG: hypothetical protein AAB250_07120, partial [Bdellovibrionota bacterium]
MSGRFIEYLIAILILVALPAHAQYNMGAMWQGPRLVFSVTPSGSAAVSTTFATQPTVALTNPKGTVIANMAKSISIAAFTDAKCTSSAGGALGATTNPLSLSSGTATFAGVNYPADATIYLKASSSGTRPVCWGPITIGTGGGGGGLPNHLPSQIPTRLFISGETSIGTNAC